MKTIKICLSVLAICFFQVLFSQDKKNTDNDADKNIEKVDQTNEEVNKTNKSANKTVKDSKETINELNKTFGGLLGTNKNASKNTIAFHFYNVEFDDGPADALFEYLEATKGVKKLQKGFKNRTISISMNYTKGISQLWSKVPKEFRRQFKVLEMNEEYITLILKKNSSKN